MINLREERKKRKTAGKTQKCLNHLNSALTKTRGVNHKLIRGQGKLREDETWNDTVTWREAGDK